MHREVLAATVGGLQGSGLQPAAILRSPITGATGNREFLLHAKLGGPVRVGAAEIEEVTRS